MDPGTRTLIQVQVADEEETNGIFETLMGKDVKRSFLFITEHAKEVQDLDI